MSEHDTQAVSVTTLTALWPTLRQVRMQPVPCRDHALLFYHGSEPVELLIDGKPYAIRPANRSRKVSDCTAVVELTSITGGTGPGSDPAA